MFNRLCDLPILLTNMIAAHYGLGIAVVLVLGYGILETLLLVTERHSGLAYFVLSYMDVSLNCTSVYSFCFDSILFIPKYLIFQATN